MTKLFEKQQKVAFILITSNTDNKYQIITDLLKNKFFPSENS